MTLGEEQEAERFTKVRRGVVFVFILDFFFFKTWLAGRVARRHSGRTLTLCLRARAGLRFGPGVGLRSAADEPPSRRV